MSGSVSVRKYIKWGNAAASEPTSTLVLTSPQRTFVDVRLLLPLSQPRPLGSPARDDPDRVDWAFAGRSTHDAGTGRSVFRHWVDSRYVDAEAVRDEGDMVPGNSGGDGPGSADETLERGSMVNPETGRMEDYEECWVEVPVGGGGHGWVLRCEEQGAGQGDRDGAGKRGMMVRLGGRVQGVLRQFGTERAGFGVVRWEVNGTDSEIKETARIGRVEGFPMDADWETVKVGDVVKGGDGWQWHCIEHW